MSYIRQIILHCVLNSHVQLGLTTACLLLQVAYLASSLFLDYKDDTIILVVNTLSTDLKSDNYLVGMPPSLILHFGSFSS